jgi:hypothetical protein
MNILAGQGGRPQLFRGFVVAVLACRAAPTYNPRH